MNNEVNRALVAKKNGVNRALVAKKKLFLFIAALTLSVGLWATTQKVSYRYPMYNTADDPTSGIKEWQTGEVEATVVESTNSPVTWDAGWYVVTGEDVQFGRYATCNGAVNLILADGARLEVEVEQNAGIKVSGEGNSLTIYAQSTGAQMGKLAAGGAGGAAGIGGGIGGDGSNITIHGGEVTAKGGNVAAGIGGGQNGSGSNITINGGTVIATGGKNSAGIGGGSGGKGTNITINGGIVTAIGEFAAAGIGGGTMGSGSNIIIHGGEVTAKGGDVAAGIGGGQSGNGSNITITGGTVTANGGKTSAGIGGGGQGSGSNIKVATYLIVKAGPTENPTEEIENDGGDIANELAGKQYVTSKTDPWKLAIAEIELAIVGVTDEDILAIAEKAKQDINAAKTEEAVNSIKTFALTKIKALVLIQTARQGIQNTEINNWIDAAFNDILKGGPDAEKGIEEIEEQIMNIITLVQIGREDGQAEALGTMGTPCTGCHAVEVTKGDKTVTLYKPTKVRYIKVPSEE